jgi:ABC-type glutathione transport system ATPase component
VLALHDIRVQRGADWSVSLACLEIGTSEVVALVGPSGCGKTTLLLGWTGLLRDLDVTGGRYVDGAAWPAANTAPWRELLAGPVTVLLQDSLAALDPLQRIGVQIDTVTASSVDARRAALRSLGVEDPDRILAARPHEISGGQAQKVLLAIALLRESRLLLADEPTASLDGASIDGFVTGLKLLREWHGTAVLLATHDLDLVRAVGARVFSHRDGRFESADSPVRAWPESPGSPSAGAVLRVRGLTKSFGATPVLRGIELELGSREVVAVVGPSGCGKSTLARILTGHLQADAGTITCAAPGELLPEAAAGDHANRADRAGAMDRARDRQLLFQDAFASLTPHRTIRSLLDETRTGSFDSEREAAAIGLCPDALDRTAAELSGGERRRAALLRSLSVCPSVLVLDEPTASLDHDAAESVMMTVMDAQRRGELACLLITHDRGLADAFGNRVLELRDGRMGA